MRSPFFRQSPFSIFFGALLLPVACASLHPDPVKPADTTVVVHEARSTLNSLVLELTEANLHRDLPFYPDRRQLYMRLFDGETPLLLYSPLGIETSDADFTHDLSVRNVRLSSAEHDYALAHGKQTRIKKKAELFQVEMQNREGKQLTLEVVMQADAVALRYVLPGNGSTRIVREATGFRFAEGRQAVMQQYQEASKVSPAYEYYFEKVRAGTSDDGKASIRRIFQPLVGFTGLTIFGSDGWALPALVEAADTKYVLLAEAGLNANHAAVHLTNPANNLYTVALPALKEGNNRGAVEPTGQLPYATAYRVILCCDLKTIAESTAITDLSAPLDKKFAGKLPQWVQPGKATWDWLSYGSTGDAERQKKYIDAAHEFGWQYTLVDANWNKWNNGNAEPRLRELVDYAGKKRIGLWLWYNSGGPSNTVTEEPRDLMHERSKRRTEFERLRKIGIKGVKIDFWQSDKQAMVQQYIETLEDAADFQLMVNFHGSTTPKGWQRRFPNLMTMEAVKGTEWYQFPVFRGPNAHDNVYYALTRNVIGPMDYTPLVFAQALDQQKISYAHSLALSVVFESGVQHFADNADDAAKGYRKLFANFPFAREFLRNVPVTWDHTLLLEGNPETHVVFAREKQGVWYIAGISAVSTELQIRQPFTFGTYGNYRAEWITEGETTDSLRYVETELHTGGRQYIDMKVKARGGFVLKLTPK
ncbi:MAG TPA: glycoside hydrolase family 97 catalytic domain-containing protein [Turneriella sp.]|nr:glycoside hydrolase family 97 catalytic domain-containing protein [Turneriella sp.]